MQVWCSHCDGQQTITDGPFQTCRWGTFVAAGQEGRSEIRSVVRGLKGCSREAHLDPGPGEILKDLPIPADIQSGE